ncbi:hypothetical protein BAUCODRAFT_122411 [Baudoinia panamericana UAMH 10762]|uniref:Ketoreductase domain-containing protein n=1 Tax=Baudoinia panamericana (strain UAMH 10762) TaxID=717646 RepID=M2MIA6_BAUPA|nr:uncharacterized protein BAUCODRAFT_122411 [Baudoinia panamericana UAMH 10762]EMC96406.1 hypothetical protein BAUCODRAFT_122411 [Baudoinia panamericana UAMH 10762]
MAEEIFTVKSLPRPTKTYHTETYDRIAPSNSDHDNKTVLITGGATGIGFEIARSFAKSGVSRIILLSRSPDHLALAREKLEAEFSKCKVETYSVSITNHARVMQIVKEVGSIDVMVLSAAAQEPFTTFNDHTVAEMDAFFQTNVIACFNLVKLYIDLPMEPSGSKTIINISSASAHFVVPQQPGYGPSKTAFAALMQHAASEYTPEKGVRIVSLHPGTIYTEAAATVFAKDALEWEDIHLPGGFCTWLATPEANFLHGKFVWAQWDVDELLAVKERVKKDPSFLTIGLVQ